MAKNKPRIGFLLVSLVCCCLAISLASARQLHIGKQQDYPPYIYEHQGQTVGVCAELVEAAFAIMGVSVSYTQYPFPRMLEYGRLGRVDAVMMVFKTVEREGFLYYPDQPLLYEENAFFTKQNTQIAYSGELEELEQYTIGVINGFSYGEVFDNAKNLKKELSRNDKMLLKKLLANRFEVGVGNRYVINYHANKMNALDKIKFLQPNLFDRHPLYIGFSRAIAGNQGLTEQFSEAIKTLKETGQYQRILQKYNLD